MLRLARLRAPLAGAAFAAAAGTVAAGWAGCLNIELDPSTAKSLLASLKAVDQKEERGPRYNELLPSPAGAKFKLAVVEFNVPGAKNGGSDKGPNGHRIDSLPIANGVIKAGGACDVIKYFDTKHAAFAQQVQDYDALIVRINPGQLSQGTLPGTQERFDALMNSLLAKGKLVWSSPDVQTKMGAKDALVKIANLECGLRDTLAYYTQEELITGFKKTCAFQPRVIKQNRGSAGEGIWLCWLCSGKYCKEYGEKSLDDGDWLKLMEMNDNHVEYHTVGEFLEFCVNGPTAKAGESPGNWQSTFPGKYLEGGKEAGGQLVDQRLLPRISEGEVRVLLSGDTCQMIIHKKPEGGLSAVGGNSAYTYYEPTDPKYSDLLAKLMKDIPSLLKVMDLEGQTLPLLWTADYIPKDPEYPRTDGVDTEYVVGEFNCSCVGISKFQAVCGGEKTLADVPDEDYYEACKLTDLMGVKAIEMLENAKK
ncbi:MAG: hypothetical protein SGPRY_001187 [Prymnesium sp.]